MFVNSLFGLTSKKLERLAFLTLCEGNPLVTGGSVTWKAFPLYCDVFMEDTYLIIDGSYIKRTLLAACLKHSMCLSGYDRLLMGQYVLYPLPYPLPTKLRGCTDFTYSLRLSVRPSVCVQTKSCPLCIFHNTCRIHFIFTHLIKQLQKVGRV